MGKKRDISQCASKYEYKTSKNTALKGNYEKIRLYETQLIFVIVILGVLAAVAIPRLSAARGDAELVKASNNILVLMGDLASYFTATGRFANDFTAMSNVVLDKQKSENISKNDALRVLFSGESVGDKPTKDAKFGDISYEAFELCSLFSGDLAWKSLPKKGEIIDPKICYQEYKSSVEEIKKQSAKMQKSQKLSATLHIKGKACLQIELFDTTLISTQLDSEKICAKSIELSAKAKTRQKLQITF